MWNSLCLHVHVYLYPCIHARTLSSCDYTPLFPCIDASYVDPLGELPERPKTAARKPVPEDDEFNDVELGNDLLPE